MSYSRSWCGGSLRQDATQGPARSPSGPGRFAPPSWRSSPSTITLVAFDWISSLEPEWYSDIFGVYLFAGTFLAGLAATSLGGPPPAGAGPAAGRPQRPPLQPRRLHLRLHGLLVLHRLRPVHADLVRQPARGGLLVPGRASRGLARADARSWRSSTSCVPFFALVTRDAKGDPARLRAVALLMLGAHLLDLYWLVFPSLGATPCSLVAGAELRALLRRAGRSSGFAAPCTRARTCPSAIRSCRKGWSSAYDRALRHAGGAPAPAVGAARRGRRSSASSRSSRSSSCPGCGTPTSPAAEPARRRRQGETGWLDPTEYPAARGYDDSAGRSQDRADAHARSCSTRGQALYAQTLRRRATAPTGGATARPARASRPTPRDFTESDGWKNGTADRGHLQDARRGHHGQRDGVLRLPAQEGPHGAGPLRPVAGRASTTARAIPRRCGALETLFASPGERDPEPHPGERGHGALARGSTRRRSRRPGPERRGGHRDPARAARALAGTRLARERRPSRASSAGAPANGFRVEWRPYGREWQALATSLPQRSA